jgi:hypothetical protein
MPVKLFNVEQENKTNRNFSVRSPMIYMVIYGHFKILHNYVRGLITVILNIYLVEFYNGHYENG